MVKGRSALSKDLFREMRISWARFLSIFAIVLLGTAFFAGIKATAPDMKNTADRYYDSNNMMDIEVLSTLGLTQGDIDAIRALPAVDKAVPAYFTDAVSTIGSTEYVFRLHSLPKVVNGVILTEGRYPQKSGECLLEDQKDLDLGLKLGDSITVSSGKEAPIVGNALKTDKFTIVGKAVTPYYLTFDKGASDIGNGKVTFFLMVPEEDFAYPVYTEALVTVKGAAELNCYGAAYRKAVENTMVSLENMGVDRSGMRLDEIKKAATEQLDKAKQEFAAKKKEYDDGMAAALEKLENSQVELGKAEATLKSEKANAAASLKQARDQIAQSKEQLAQGEKQYQSAVKQYTQLKSQYYGQLSRLSSSLKQLASLRTTAQAAIPQLQSLLNDPNLPAEYRPQITNLLSMYKQLIKQADQGIKAANSLNGFAQGQLRNAKTQLDQGRKELDDGKKQVKDAEAKLAKNEKDANAKFAQAEKDIAAGWDEYNKGKQEYDSAKQKGAAELEDAQAKIVQAEDEIDRISKPQWYVLDRNSNASFVDFGMTADRIDAIAKAFPVFFFLVAALVCLTTMTRMVDEQRGIIGVYKALGYQNGSIAAKYIWYAAVASALGAAAGLFAGINIFPEVIYKSWLMKYTMPPLQAVIQPGLMAVSFCLGLLVTTLTAWAACRRELAEVPATLMRPKAPKAGKRILLERISFLWKCLSFSQKVTMRNLFRYKKRFLMTVIGIAGCMALLLAGFGLNNSIGRVVGMQFGEIFAYDLNLRFQAAAGETNHQRALDALKADANVLSELSGSELNAKARSTGSDIAVTLVVPSDAKAFTSYITLRDSASQRGIALGDTGAVITEKLSKELSVGVGDAIELDNGLGARKKVIVSGITENYIFHYVYMSTAYYKEIFRLEPEKNSLMIKLNDDSPAAENSLASKLISGGGVASVTFYASVAEAFRETVKSLNTIIIVIILCAGLLAFIVLYNLTNINIGERIREIATVKVLGFWNREVSSYVFRENILLSIIGSLLGMPLGILLHRYVMVSIEQSGIMFGSYMSNMSFLWAFIITMVFTGLVTFAMGFRLRRIPMVESLKSVE